VTPDLCSEIEGTTPVTVRNSKGISRKLRAYLGHHKLREIAEDTGYHPESVRRYLRGETSIPAEFIGAVCGAYGLDAMTLLIDGPPRAFRRNPDQTPEDRLAEEIASTLGEHLKEWMRDHVEEFEVFLKPTPATPIVREADNKLDR
jgi:transcriptional regulator with XRE-family HTH domain